MPSFSICASAAAIRSSPVKGRSTPQCIKLDISENSKDRRVTFLSRILEAATAVWPELKHPLFLVGSTDKSALKPSKSHSEKKNFNVATSKPSRRISAFSRIEAIYI